MDGFRFVTVIAPREGRRTGPGKPVSRFSRNYVVWLKFFVNVEHARVNKQPSHLHDCPSVTHCLPRQRYTAPRRAGLRFIQRSPIDKFDAGADGSSTAKGAARTSSPRELRKSDLFPRHEFHVAPASGVRNARSIRS